METNSPTVQLYLPVQTRLEKSFDHFLGSANLALIDCLKAHCLSNSETLVFLVGPPLVGKTHLLSSSVQYFEEHSPEGQVGSYFSLTELLGQALSEAFLTDLLGYLEGFNFLALDDLDDWLSQIDPQSRAAAELFLFNLFNHFKMNGKRLIIASKCTPSRLPIDLKDLRSRLMSGLLVTVKALDDVEKKQLICDLARLKGFALADDVSAYILKRGGRDIASLLNILDDLDKATLIEKRKLTVPFVKRILNW